MSDICRQADRIVAMYTDAAITSARNFKRDIEPRGICHNCEETLTDARKLFCDSECADDYEKRVKR